MTNEINIGVSNVVLNHQACGVEITVERWGDFAYNTDIPEVETFTGVSKTVPPDRYDEQIGYELAFWRAVDNAANKNIRRLNGIVKHKDDIREQKNDRKIDFSDPEAVVDAIEAMILK